MKLLLTSSGITNRSLAAVVRKLVKGKIKIAFIPTAANVVEEEKSWLINDFNNCQKLGTVDIVDISALPKRIWLPRLKRSNVIVVGGGDSSHLMKCIISSGFKEELPKLLKTHIYVGISAGSIVMSKNLRASSSLIFSKNKGKFPKGLNFINFYTRPHLNSPKRPKCRINYLDKIVKNFDKNVYAIDDNSGVLVDGNKIEVISEGKWKLYKRQR